MRNISRIQPWIFLCLVLGSLNLIQQSHQNPLPKMASMSTFSETQDKVHPRKIVSFQEDDSSTSSLLIPETFPERAALTAKKVIIDRVRGDTGLSGFSNGDKQPEKELKQRQKDNRQRMRFRRNSRTHRRFYGSKCCYVDVMCARACRPRWGRRRGRRGTRDSRVDVGRIILQSAEESTTLPGQFKLR